MGFFRFNWEILNLHFQEALMLVLFPIVYSVLPEGKSIGLQARMQFLKAWSTKHLAKTWARGFPGGAVVENLPANAGHTGSSPGLGRSHMPRSN